MVAAGADGQTPDLPMVALRRRFSLVSEARGGTNTVFSLDFLFFFFKSPVSPCGSFNFALMSPNVLPALAGNASN